MECGSPIKTLSFAFCDGHFDAIQASSPPPVSFFRDLPIASTGQWGIYVMILAIFHCWKYVFDGRTHRTAGKFSTCFCCCHLFLAHHIILLSHLSCFPPYFCYRDDLSRRSQPSQSKVSEIENGLFSPRIFHMVRSITVLLPEYLRW